MSNPLPFPGGPYFSAAFLCERVLEEKDGVKSAIRIIDRVTRTVIEPSPPEKMEPFEYDVTLFLRWKSGEARGPSRLEVHLVKPSGESAPPLRQTIFFEGEEDRGVDIVINMKLRLELTGIYGFRIFLEGVLVTQIPLRVIYMPQAMQIPPAGGSSPPAPGPATAA